ncbi:hypothetical protein ABZX90_33020 [Streptomyces sp. NPDC002935]|uniref:hypothetical protein n=1 Tax=Streptomyces sp. NPDC002935 TaxID=3154545 RepID=UPI0033B7AB17
MSVLLSSLDPHVLLLVMSSLLGITLIKACLKYAITRMVLKKLTDGQDLARVLIALALLFGVPAQPDSLPPTPPTEQSENQDGTSGGAA